MKGVRRFLLWATILVSASVAAAFLFYKPLHALVPEWFGLTCVSATLCVEDTTTAEAAAALRDEAIAFVAAQVGPIERPPRVLFCSTEACFARFGNPAVAALYFWGLDTILINHKGWEAHILRHEMIHHWQVEQFGGLRSSRFPRWYIEGMAYAFSEDPRDPLPRPDIQAWRAEFLTWLADGNNWRIPPTAPE